jgi:hypothetical protein
MRYPTSEKLEIIRLVEESALPVRWTLEKIGIPRATFYRWGTVRNLVCEAMMMRTDGASYGDRERFTGPTFGRS